MHLLMQRVRAFAVAHAAVSDATCRVAKATAPFDFAMSGCNRHRAMINSTNGRDTNGGCNLEFLFGTAGIRLHSTTSKQTNFKHFGLCYQPIHFGSELVFVIVCMNFFKAIGAKDVF